MGSEGMQRRLVCLHFHRHITVISLVDTRTRTDRIDLGTCTHLNIPKRLNTPRYVHAPERPRYAHIP